MTRHTMEPSRRMLRRLCAGLAAACAALVPVAAAADVVFGAHDVRTVFFVTKSDDRNRADYAVHLDAACRPAGQAPVFAYWRVFEGGRRGVPTAPLNMLDEMAYAPGAQVASPVAAGGGTVRFTIRALPTRTIEVHARSTPAGCQAVASTEIAGVRSLLDSVHLTLGDLPGTLRYGELRGRAVDDHRALVERIVAPSQGMSSGGWPSF